MREYLYRAVFILSVAGYAIFFAGFLNMFFPRVLHKDSDFFDKWETIEIRLPEFKEKNPLNSFELERLFPNYESDWEFAQKLLGVSGLRLPTIRYEYDDDFNEFQSNGHFDSEDYMIALDRDIFATGTPEYYRYVMLHELVHAAQDRSAARPLGDWHCHMAEEEMFLAIGERIGNRSLGAREQEKYEGRCGWYEEDFEDL